MANLKTVMEQKMQKKDIVINFIRENIKSGKYKPGTRILSEAMMQVYLKVSRYSVREAVMDLEKEGILEKRQGSGTYIKKKEDKYIIISASEVFFISEISNYYRRLIDLFQKSIKEAGYIPMLYLEKKVEGYDILKYINIPLSQIIIKVLKIIIFP